MERKTIKLNENEYTNLDDDFKEHDIIILMGARGTGKSYPTAKYISKKLEDDENAKFIYMRNSFEELATYESWCKDLNLKKLCGCNKFKLTRGQTVKGEIALIGFGEDDKIIYNRVIGKCIDLANSHLYKSGKYDEYVALVFEEYTQKNMNPEREKLYTFNFLENIQSIFRNRNMKIFCIGNTLNSIPLLDKMINELTPTIFKNPLKIKIFKKGDKKIENAYLKYLQGEMYEDDEMIFNINEYRKIFVNKKYVIYQHYIYTKNHYITRNSNNDKMNYKKENYLILDFFCKNSSNNIFKFKDNKLEYDFTDNYFELLHEITQLLVTFAKKYL